ncbi:MAG: ATP-binding protein [Nitrospiraceae bacterium]|nr:ATP-binding protein [Nitrospiraceae bacterium]
MKIEQKIILSNAIHVVLIVLIGFVSFQNLSQVLTKLRFVEIADDLNASFLEMRLSEKNYFLYQDRNSLLEIRQKIEETGKMIDAADSDVRKAVGEDSLSELRGHLKQYAEVVDQVSAAPRMDSALEFMFRAKGKGLREYSRSITQAERGSVNAIIGSSKTLLVYLFLAVLLAAVLVSHFISQKILRSLRDVKKLTESISEGNFNKIAGAIPRDEFGSLMTAVNFMSEELSKREEELIQAKKLASIGILTAGVAHELTNPLNNISMITQNYIEMYDFFNKENGQALLQKILGETERIEKIVRNLLDFSKPREANLTRSDINRTVQNALRLMQNTLDISNVDLGLNLQKDLPYVPIDDNQIQQVMVNLIANAVQAMAGGGRLSVGTRLSSNREAVEIAVSDSGKGIPPESLPHIFDPFFSTKGAEGTGLGLSVSYGIIKNHRGHIRVESKVGEGTTFIIDLPINNH